MKNNLSYTTQLQAGLGLISETRTLLDLWQPGMTASRLNDAGLESGRFPTMTARRLRNVVAECFGPRYLVDGGAPASRLKQLVPRIPAAESQQLMLIYTARANRILADFIRGVFWPRYSSGYSTVGTDEARAFVVRAMDEGKTSRRWSESTVRRVSAYLIGCCSDFGLVESAGRSTRRILPYRLLSNSAAYLAHDLHFHGLPDAAVLTHEDWGLFGLDREEVIAEVKTLALKSLLILQSAGDLVRISWKFDNMEALCDVLAQG